MDIIEELSERNEAFSGGDRFDARLRIIPSLKTIIVGCVDPRVDPAEIFSLAPGEAAVYRNIGGRITPATLETIVMLRSVAKAGGGEMGPGWHLIVLHHTDCGIKALAHSQDLANHFGVGLDDLEHLAISDPYASVAIDVAKLKSDPDLPAGFLVTGIVYDVANGLTNVVVPSSLLRIETAT